MKKTVAILLCLALLAGFCGFALRSPAETAPELVEEVLDATEEEPAEAPAEPGLVEEVLADAAPEADGSAEPELDGGLPTVKVNNVTLEDGQYIREGDEELLDGFVYGSTDDYMAGYAGGVLYLKWFNVSAQWEYGIYSDVDLAIVLEGNSSMFGNTAAIYAGGTLTIRGNGSLYAVSNDDGIWAGGDVTIESGVVSASGSAGAGIQSGGDVALSGGTANASGNDAAIRADAVTIAAAARLAAWAENDFGGVAVVADEISYGGSGMVWAGSCEQDAARVAAAEFCANAGNYRFVKLPDIVTVGGVALANGQYLAGNSATTATGGFVPGETTPCVAGYADGVLYLYGYELDGYDLLETGIDAPASLTVELQGDSALQGCEYAIWAAGNLTIRGDGRLTASASEDGLGADGDVTIDGGEITAEGTAYDGIYSVYGDITLNGGTVNATGGEAGLAAYEGSVTVGHRAGLRATSLATYTGGYGKGCMAILAGGDVNVEISNVIAGQSLIDSWGVRSAAYCEAPEDYLYVNIDAVQIAVLVNGLVLQDGQYMTSNSFTSITNGFEYGVTTGYVAGYADGVLYLNGVDGSSLSPLPTNGILSDNDLTVVLQGENKLSSQMEGIQCFGTLTIRGSGSLEIQAEDGCACQGAWGVSVESGTLLASSREYDGIVSMSGDIAILGGSVTATAGDYGAGLFTEHTVEIAGSATVDASGGQAGIRALSDEYAVVIGGRAEVTTVGGQAGIQAPYGSVTVADSAVVSATATGDAPEFDEAPALDGIPSGNGAGIDAAEGELSIYSEAVLAGGDKESAKRVATAAYIADSRAYPYVSIPYVAPAPAPAPAAKAPATGDGASPLLWLALLAVAGCGLALLPRKKSRT